MSDFKGAVEMYYRLNGDLNQMLIQKQYLEFQCRGFELSQDGFIPYLESKAEYDRAICCIWHDRIEGFWNYKDELIKIGEITEEIFFEVLNSRVSRS